jgi:hypothetical protein
MIVTITAHFRVVSNKVGVTALEWDLPGDKLLVADTAGNVQLWSFKDHILNDWLRLGTASFPGEHILGAAFFHNGKKVTDCAFSILMLFWLAFHILIQNGKIIDDVVVQLTCPRCPPTTYST